MSQISHNAAFLELCKEHGEKGVSEPCLALGFDFSQIAVNLGYFGFGFGD